MRTEAEIQKRIAWLEAQRWMAFSELESWRIQSVADALRWALESPAQPVEASNTRTEE